MRTFIGIWSIWPQLGVLHKLYWLLLSLVSVYTLYSAACIVRNVRNASPEGSWLRLEAQVTHLRQVIAAMSLAFGAFLFGTLPTAFHTIGHSRTSPVYEIMRDLEGRFAFAANVFFVLLLLHGVQWFASVKLREGSVHRQPHSIPLHLTDDHG